MREWILGLSKAELHVHLEGSIDPETLCEIDPSLSIEDARAGYRYEDFQGFLQSFAFVAKRLTKPEHYALAARHLFQKLASQNVYAVEPILSVGVVLWKGQDFAAVWDALVQESARTSLKVRWNLDAVRQWGPEKAMAIAKLAAERVSEGAVSFGLGGDEGSLPASDFQEVFAFARDSGLRLTCHAGEVCGPASVWGALEVGAERIGHGIRAIEDPALVRHLAEKQIPLEVSITSNVCTRAVGSLEEHPVRRLYDAGVPIVLNTDDPSLFGTDLVSEYEVAMRSFGFGQAEVEAVAGNSLRFGF